MGGEDSGINDGTTNVLLEGAFFTPSIVAGRGRRYGLITDASQRFERGVDPELQERAIERATQLLLESAGGTPGPLEVTRTAERYPARAAVRVRHARVQHVLGAPLTADAVADCLVRLGMKVEGSAPVWSVTPPSWRFDISIEEDLIEEVARLYGFDNIPEKNEIAAQRMQPWTEARVRNERAADVLVDRGYQEAITYSFTDPAMQALLLPDAAFALANPISAELAVMRVSLWPGLLQALGSNQRRQQSRARLFEVGRRYAGADGAETEVIAAVVAGSTLPEQWGSRSDESRFLRREGGCRSVARAHRRGRAIPLRARSSSGASPRTVGPHLAWRSRRGMAGRAPSGAFAAARFDISGVRVRGRDARRACA